MTGPQLITSIALYAVVLLVFLFFLIKAVISIKNLDFTSSKEPIADILTIFSVFIITLNELSSAQILSNYYTSFLALIISPFLVKIFFGRICNTSNIIYETLIFSLCGACLFYKSIVIIALPIAYIALILGVIIQAGILLWKITASTDSFGGKDVLVSLLSLIYDYMCLLLTMAFFLAGLLLSPPLTWWKFTLCTILPLCIVGIYSIQCVRNRSGRIFITNEVREKLFVTFHKNQLLTYVNKGFKKNETYGHIFLRVADYFDEKSPYLNPELTINDVAKALLTNRLYISRAVKIYTGGNFCTYVNGHRIKYAMHLFLKNNALTVNDLSNLSGFKTTRSFSMAFRLYTNLSPSEWCRDNSSG